MSYGQFSKLCVPKTAETTEPGSEEAASTAAPSDSVGIKGLPKYSLPLYEYLKTQSPRIDWTLNNELLISGVLVPNSNIQTLLKDATNPKNENIQSDSASWRVFKNWLLDNKIPTDLLNDNVTAAKEQLPIFQNPAVASEFPSIEELKSSDAPLTTSSKDKPATEERNEKRAAIRKSSRVIRPPKKYGRGIGKWIRF